MSWARVASRASAFGLLTAFRRPLIATLPGPEHPEPVKDEPDHCCHKGRGDQHGYLDDARWRRGDGVQDSECCRCDCQSGTERDESLDLMASCVRSSPDAEGHPAVNRRVKDSRHELANEVRGLCRYAHAAQSKVKQHKRYSASYTDTREPQ